MRSSDADRLSWGLLFNSVTNHPNIGELLFSSRKEVTDRLYRRMAREIRRQQRLIDRRRLRR